MLHLRGRSQTGAPALVLAILLLGVAMPAGTAAASPPVSPAPPPSAPASTPAWATDIVTGSVNRTSLALTATYDADVRLGWAARTLRGTVVIDIRNDSGGGIDRVELNTVMARLGALHLGATTVDGTAVRPVVDDQTITVPLGGVLPGGATTRVRLTFSATLRSGTTGDAWLFTRANGIADLYRWLPWVSRRTASARPNFGDPFVTPASPRVTLRLRTDILLRVAATGDRTAISADGLDMTFTATRVRDMVVAAAADYRTTQTWIGDTAIRVIARPGFPAAAVMAAARTALARLEARLGPYPYRVLKIVQSAGGYGMEGPGVAWIPAGVPGANVPYLVTHEIAHQWFYGIVGNDQAREPFADEAPTDFVTRDILGMRRAARCSAIDLDRSIYAYSKACYYEIVYISGGNLLASARSRMGADAFWAALRGYVADHRFGLVHTRTLLDALDAATPRDLGAWWAGRFPRLYPA